VRPIVLTIAGADPSGGAGIQADLKAIEASGGYGACAITAITVQNTLGVQRVRAVEPELVREQVRAVLDDLDVGAIKSGMLGAGNNVAVVADLLREWRPRPYVLDPVVASADGFPLLDEAAIELLKHRLVPLAALLTPNVEDVRALTGRTIRSVEEAEIAGRDLLELGCDAVLVKGGHLHEVKAADVLVSPSGTRVFSSERLDSPHTHGTGCVYAASIATRLARGLPLEDAVAGGKALVTDSIRHGLRIGAGRGPTDPLFRLHGGRTASTAEGDMR
jgi:hydroxymethylpyrimidine/phosphomethylpyrimidine kinase